MKLKSLLIALVFIATSLHAQDWHAQQKAKDRERAAYWAERGYRFDATYTSAWSMDQKVKDIERAKHWKTQGYSFDTTYMSAWSMDQKVKDIERAKYWREHGYTFDPAYMTAWSMDSAVRQAQTPKQTPQAPRAIASTTSPSRPTVPPVTSTSATAYYPRVTSSAASSGRYYDYNYRPSVGDHYVSPHIRSDGTFVQGHMKTDSDDSFWNNWSSSGNLNPYTGRTGSKVPPYSSSYRSYGGSSYVGGYTRRDGTYVSGHYRRK